MSTLSLTCVSVARFQQLPYVLGWPSQGLTLQFRSSTANQIKVTQTVRCAAFFRYCLSTFLTPHQTNFIQIFKSSTFIHLRGLQTRPRWSHEARDAMSIHEWWSSLDACRSIRAFGLRLTRLRCCIVTRTSARAMSVWWQQTSSNRKRSKGQDGQGTRHRSCNLFGMCQRQGISGFIQPSQVNQNLKGTGHIIRSSIYSGSAVCNLH